MLINRTLSTCFNYLDLYNHSVMQRTIKNNAKNSCNLQSTCAWTLIPIFLQVQFYLILSISAQFSFAPWPITVFFLSFLLSLNFLSSIIRSLLLSLYSYVKLHYVTHLALHVCGEALCLCAYEAGTYLLPSYY